ncbi:prolyl oligopeptidase family serine peptidase [Flavobacteriaceae bacterium S0825]|uniref:carboxylesterase family protein n=1 Tax=Gaetbulibacter sp. S0825 TaxID=2720084 RepID=UPI0014307DA4|nr:prolyl oligopeptidase family serine peptidase [Gaetbulibacter sp. S0825]MCK0108542.1 prolyl oligopeptidase family serine peptidase [Flavobacteriaceae bacterium S0825]NIX64178.1 prolyl oligopeptidase family serine peptidase [Gaetbulibacter sp. S0825]
MKKFKNTLLLMVTISAIVSCSKNESAPTPQARTADDVIEDFQNLDVQPGINDFRLETLVKDTYWSFRVIAPADATIDNLRPLVIDLHGASGGSPSAHQNTECYVETGLQTLNAFIISPNAGFDEWYDSTNQQQILALVDLAKSNWFINPSQVIITGYSNGGNGSWFYADYYPELFSAAIPMASSYDPARSSGEVLPIEVPMYVIHGEDDELFPIAETEAFVNESIDAGSSIEFVVATGLSHLDVCDYASYLADAATWVQTEIWN